MSKIEVLRNGEACISIFAPNTDGSFFHLKTVHINVVVHKQKSLSHDLAEAFRKYARKKKSKSIEYDYEGSTIFCEKIICSIDGGYLNCRPILLTQWERLGLEKK